MTEPLVRRSRRPSEPCHPRAAACVLPKRPRPSIRFRYGRYNRHNLGAPAIAVAVHRRPHQEHRGMPLRAASTSSAKIFSPPLLIVTASRPRRRIEPSSRRRARSPVIAQRCPRRSVEKSRSFYGDRVDNPGALGPAFLATPVLPRPAARTLVRSAERTAVDRSGKKALGLAVGSVLVWTA